MRTIIKPVYYCEFCNHKCLAKWAMKRHELMCFNNPANKRPCFTCNFLTKKEANITHYHYDEIESIQKVNDFYCSKKDVFLYTPKNEIKGNRHDLDEGNEPMPKECDLYDDNIETFDFERQRFLL